MIPSCNLLRMRHVATLFVLLALGLPAAAWPGESSRSLPVVDKLVSLEEPQGPAGSPEVKIVTPRPDRPLPNPIVIQALVRSSSSRPISGVVAYFDDQELATLTEPPYRWIVSRAARTSLAHVRVVATDSGGLAGDDEVMVAGAPGLSFEAEVPAVSLNVGALDEQGGFALDLRPQEIVLRDNDIEQEILDFTRSEAPLRVAILIDHSGSMGGKMADTVEALVEFLQRLEPDDQVKLMGFNHSVTSYTPFTDQHDMVANFAQGIQAEGGTALYDALLYAFHQLEPYQLARERRVIFLLSDGKDRESRTAAEPALELVRAGGVTVFALGQGEALRDEDLREVLLDITRTTGGDAYFESDRGRLRETFTEIAKAMRALYFLSYRPTDSSAGWHEITIEIGRPGLRARHKPGYQVGDGGSR